MYEVIIENLSEVIAVLLKMLIGILGTWLTIKLGKREEAKTLAIALAEATEAVQDTVLELKQTIVDNLKANSPNGKLTAEEIDALRHQLIVTTESKLSLVAMEVIAAAGTDLEALILGKGEAFIAELKANAAE